MLASWSALVAGLLLASASTAPAVEAPILGFSDSRVEAQRRLEAAFDSHLKAGNLRDWMKKLTARPHHVGSPHGKENAEFMAGLLRDWGYETRIEVFHVLFPTPTHRSLEMVAPTSFSAVLAEPPIPGDTTSSQTDEQLPTYNAFSIDGKVTGELVYVNYGIPDDYKELESRGIDVTGKIVLARYGGSWRGIKPKVAAENGAIGCILFSDPRDDGYYVGDVYPRGGYRPALGAQRGSVLDMPLYPGDPLTPGVGATENAPRMPREQAPTLTKIPVLPISHEDALPLLQSLQGPVAPPAWRGALPLTYHLGPGPARVRLELKFDWDLTPAYNVVATMAGAERPDQWIIRGNHHDAWVNGATDPISGMVALLSEARAVAALVKDGWKPKRTIVYAAWDAEEPGLLGSTEWVEAHAAELAEKAAVYINTDSSSRGFLAAGGSHTLEMFMNQVAQEVTDPLKGMSVGDRSRARLRVHGSAEVQERVESTGVLPLYPLGSGSDYTPFLQHVGIASLNLSYGGEGEYGQYHSVYDSFDHFVKFMDPGFEYGMTLSRTCGRTVLRLAGADVLPFEFGSFVETVGRYVDEVVELGETQRQATVKENGRLEDGVYEAIAHPDRTFVAPRPEAPVPHLNFAPLRNALATLAASVARYADAWNVRLESGRSLSAAENLELDAILMRSERVLTRPEGLPGRPWFTHHIYAPGFYTGYGVKTLPGVREAIEQREWEQAEEQIGKAAEVLMALAVEVDAGTALLAAPAGS